ESEGENGCDLLACFTSFSNILFDAEYEFDSVDNQSLSDEDFPKEIYSNPLFEEEINYMRIYQHHFDAESDLIESMLNRDSSIISSSLKIDSLLDEFVGELILLKSISSGINETDCYSEEDIRLIERLLYDNSSPRPPKEFVFENSDAAIEYFFPSPIPTEDSDSFVEEIDLSFNPDDPMPPSIEDDDDDFERDILIFEDFESEGENSCDLLACFTTFSNILFDAEYEFDSVDNQSLSDEDFPKEIYSNPLFEEEINYMRIYPHHFDAESDLIESMLNRDSSIISSSLKINSLLDEFAGELILLKSISSRIDETDCYSEEDIRLIERLLYDNSSPHPPKEFVFENSDAVIESFFPSPIPTEDSDSFVEEIDLSFNPDDPMPPSIEDDDDDFERDIIIFEDLSSNYSLSLPINESFYFDIPSFSRPPAKPPYVVQYFWKRKDSCQRILSSKSSFPQLQLEIKYPNLID
nr:hypothetical protein [Tanacetum cinerariifolium]